jgi:hypothetical protein
VAELGQFRRRIRPGFSGLLPSPRLSLGFELRADVRADDVEAREQLFSTLPK